MARKKAIIQSVVAAQQIPRLDRPLLPSKTSEEELGVEVIAKLMFAGQWGTDTRTEVYMEFGCSPAKMAKYERDAQRLVRMSMRHSGKAFERLSGVLNEVIDRSLATDDLRTAVAAAGKLADITGLNKQVIEHREGDQLEDFRRRILAGEDINDVAREATNFILGVQSGTVLQ